VAPVVTNHEPNTPIQISDPLGAAPEFCRTKALFERYGIRRSTAYALLASGRIKSFLLRVQGIKRGLRLWDCESVSALIRSQMAEGGAA
jgi:hypothetical protein